MPLLVFSRMDEELHDTAFHMSDILEIPAFDFLAVGMVMPVSFDVVDVNAGFRIDSRAAFRADEKIHVRIASFVRQFLDLLDVLVVPDDVMAVFRAVASLDQIERRIAPVHDDDVR